MTIAGRPFSFNVSGHAMPNGPGVQKFAKEAAMSKLYCSEIAKEVADESVQIHGGYGLMKEFDIERFYRDQRLLQIGEGTSEIQRLVISRYIGC